MKVMDNGTLYGPLSFSTTLTIVVNKVLRPPSVLSQTFYVNEDSPTNTFVNVIPAQPRPGELLHFSILSGDTQGAFFVQDCSGTLFVNNSVLDFENPVLNYFNHYGAGQRQGYVAVSVCSLLASYVLV